MPGNGQSSNTPLGVGVYYYFNDTCSFKPTRSIPSSLPMGDCYKVCMMFIVVG